MGGRLEGKAVAAIIEGIVELRRRGEEPAVLFRAAAYQEHDPVVRPSSADVPA